jgi:spermidine/putrescine transport system substrate-binding protein
VNRFFKVFLLTVLFSFGWGAWWGFYNLESQKPDYKKGKKIRFLAVQGYFQPDFLKVYEKKNGLQVILTEKPTEIETLREAMSRPQDYDVIQLNSFVSKSFILDNVFAQIDFDEIPKFSDVSIDFKNLDYDADNRYLVPTSWGFNGFVINSKLVSLKNETLSELLEVYSLVVKLKPIIKTWVETGQTSQLNKELSDVKSKISLLLDDPRPMLSDGKLLVAQLSNGKAAKLFSDQQSYRYVLPIERASLWVSFVGISRDASNFDLAYKAVNALLKADMNQLLVTTNEQASVLDSLNSSQLPMLQKAQFIRKVPLSRVELYINHESVEPTWQQIVQKEWPKSVTEKSSQPSK